MPVILRHFYWNSISSITARTRLSRSKSFLLSMRQMSLTQVYGMLHFGFTSKVRLSMRSHDHFLCQLQKRYAPNVEVGQSSNSSSSTVPAIYSPLTKAIGILTGISCIAYLSCRVLTKLGCIYIIKLL